MKPIFKPQTEWLPPQDFPDLSNYSEIAIDLETKDPDLKTIGSGSVIGRSKIVGSCCSCARLERILSYCT